MSVLDLRNFSGLQPRYGKSDEAMQYANVANNVDLSGGTIRPWRTAKFISYKVGNVLKCGCDFKVIDYCERVTYIKGDCDLAIVSGVTRPRFEFCDSKACDPFYLGVTPPLNPPTISYNTPNVERNVASVSYVYTFVNSLCHESAPSMPSNSINHEAGSTVLIDGFSVPDVGECVTSIRVYRSETGFRSGTEEVQEQTTYFYLVAEIPIDNTSLTDNVIAKNLGSALETNHFYPPDTSLKSIQNIRSTDNVLVGFTGNEIHFSTPNLPHVWKLKNIITLPSQIIGIESGDFYTVAFTHNGIFTILENGDCDGTGFRQVVESHFNIGFILLADGRAGLFTPDGVIFNTATGLHRVGSDGVPMPLMLNFFDERAWRKLRPETIRLGYTRQHLFIISDTDHFIWSYGNDMVDRLTTISDEPNFMSTSDQGELLLHGDNGIFQWNAGNGFREFTWINEFRSTTKTHFTLVHVDQEGINKITMNDSIISFIDGIKFRLKRNGKKRHNKVSLKGRYEINRVCFASTLIELGRVG